MGQPDPYFHPTLHTQNVADRSVVDTSGLLMPLPQFQSTDPTHIPAQGPPSSKHPHHAYKVIPLAPSVLAKSDTWLH